MKDSAVLQLQRMALDENQGVADILNFAYMIARKIKHDDFINFCKKERDGYADEDICPEYRKLRGTVNYSDPWGVHKPLIINIKDVNPEIFGFRFITNPVSNIQEMYLQADQFLTTNMDHRMEKTLKSLFDEQPPPLILKVSKDQLASVLASVKHIIIDWALELESQGVYGSGLFFTEEEKVLSQNIIYNFHGEVANVANHNTDSDINQKNEIIKAGDIISLLKQLELLGIDQSDLNQLIPIINAAPNDTINEPIQGWITRVASESYAIAKGVTIDILSKAIQTFLGIP